MEPIVIPGLNQILREAMEENEREFAASGPRQLAACVEALGRRGAPVDQASEDTHPISTALRQAIQAAGGYQEVARESGVSRTSLYQFTAGRGNLSLANVDQLATYFGLQLHAMEAVQAT